MIRGHAEAAREQKRIRTRVAPADRRQLVLDKRRLFKRIHGRIFCEVCGLVPWSGLGEAAEACFEAHHLTRLSEASSPVATRLDDVALLCANCHRIIHRLDPLPSIEELRSRIAQAE